MSDLKELYQDTILDHNKNPRNFHKMPDATLSLEGYNPLCGDHLFLYVKLDNDVITDVSFEGSGCAISKSSASLMTTVLKGKRVDEAISLFEKFHDLITSPMDKQPNTDGLGKLAVFSGVREFPARIKCAGLAWHTLKSALEGDQRTISTEQ
ncbi:MAG: SUF system NifU family Fe-S cluster assembly protein [Bacteroidetes bacterium]|nr:SUF system NifU family Fe-S cluster assembly protein [Bacteroidota bacterium]